MLSSDEIRWLKRLRSQSSGRIVSGVLGLGVAAVQFWSAYDYGIVYQMPDGTQVLTRGALHLILAVACVGVSLGALWSPQDRLLISLAERMEHEHETKV